MSRSLFVPVAVLLTMSASYGQEMTNLQMTETIYELERPVGILEQTMLPEKSTAIEAARPERSVVPVQWKKLEVGMNAAEVQALLGEPLHVEREGGRSTWRYSAQRWHSSVRFSDDGVSSWSKPE